MLIVISETISTFLKLSPPGSPGVTDSKDLVSGARLFSWGRCFPHSPRYPAATELGVCVKRQPVLKTTINKLTRVS